MNLSTGDCPDAEDLERFLDEVLDKPKSQRIELHVVSCTLCQRALDRLTSDTATSLPSRQLRLLDLPLPNESFLTQLKAAGPDPSCEASTLGFATNPTFRDDPEPSLWPTVPGYEILGVLGSGGVGVVYQARQRLLGRLVALKMLRTASRDDTEELARLRLEAETLARLQHPNIVQIHDFGLCDGRPFLALEHVAGGTLGSQLTGKPQLPLEAAQLVETLARAVDVAHRAGIVHRDLKPANVLLDRHGQEAGRFGIPKITDFGLAKRLHVDGGLTRTGAVMGTPGYMAPEQVRGEVRSIGPAADIHALGAILYQLLTGQPPFSGIESIEVLLQVAHQEPVRPRRRTPNVPLDLETICLKCLEKDPARRYSTAKALAADLERFRRGAPIEARPVRTAERLWRWCRRNRRVAALSAALAFFVVGGTFGGIGLWQQSEVHRKSAEAQRQERSQAHAAARQAVRDYLETEDSPLVMSVEAREQRRRELASALQLFRDFLARSPDDAANLAARADALYAISLILADGGTKSEALVAMEEARTALLRLVAEEPGRAGSKDSLAQANLFAGRLYQLLGRREEARAAFAQARAIREQIASENPVDLPNQVRLGQCMLALGLLHADMSLTREAQAAFDETRLLAERLREQGATPPVRRLQAQAWTELGGLEREAGKLAEARRWFEQARDLLLGQDDDAPREIASRELLGNVLTRLGNIYLGLGNVDAARASQTRAAEIFEAMVRTHGSLPSHRHQLAQIFGNLGLLDMQRGRTLEAERAWWRAHELFQGLIRDEPQSLPFRTAAASGASNLAQLVSKLGRPSEALPLSLQARDLREQVVRESTAPAHRGDLSHSWLGLGMLLGSLGRHLEADMCFGRAIELLVPLCKEVPEHSRYPRVLGKTWTNRGNVLSGIGQSDAALAAHVRAQQIFEESLRKTPSDLEFRNELAIAFHNQAHLHELQGSLEDARSALEQAIRHQQLVVAKATKVVEYRNHLNLHYHALCRVQRRMGDAAASVATAETRRLLWPGVALEQYQAASQIALCIPLVGDESVGLTEAETAKRKQYGDQSLAALNAAIAAGYSSLETVRGDPDLDALRSRADFKKLVQDLEATNVRNTGRP